MTQAEFRPGNRVSLDERSSSNWALSTKLFGEVGVDIWDFELSNYVYFLDHVPSVQDLREGLWQLSPLADDALAVAEKMEESDFALFKQALLAERLSSPQSSTSLQPHFWHDLKIPSRFHSLLIPDKFISGFLMTSQFAVPLGTALIRIMEELALDSALKS